MKFDKILNEIFASDFAAKNDYYSKNITIKKNAPKRFTPYIMKNGINDVDSSGILKPKKVKS